VRHFSKTALLSKLHASLAWQAERQWKRKPCPISPPPPVSSLTVVLFVHIHRLDTVAMPVKLPKAAGTCDIP